MTSRWKKRMKINVKKACGKRNISYIKNVPLDLVLETFEFSTFLTHFVSRYAAEIVFPNEL